jgi:hypothetical protein
MHDLAAFYDPGSIKKWLADLPEDVQFTEFFAHGRFSRIFTAELDAPKQTAQQAKERILSFLDELLTVS